jgi:hypothetical protein
MGFLSDLGRSNAIQSVNNLSNTAVQLKGLQNKDEQQGFENAISIEKMGMLKNEHDVDMRIKSAQAKEVEEKAKADATPYDISVDPRYLALPPESQKIVMDHSIKNKYTDQNGLGTRRSAKQLLADMEGKSELFTSSFGPVVEGKKKAVTEAWSILQDAKVKGDPKKIQEAQAEFDKASFGYQSTQAGFTGHLSALEKERAKQEGKIEKGPGGGLYRRKEDSTLEELVAPPEKGPKTDQDRFVEDRAEAYRAKSGTEATPEQRAGWRMEYHRAPVDTGARSDKAETKEEKRKAKTLDTARREVERAYGYSQFLPTAQDPQLIEKVGKGKALVEDIIDNFKEYGLPKEPTPGKAAEISKRIIEKQYGASTTPGAAPVVPTDQAKKEMEILGLLRPKGNK